jgi:signal transduction histidine kinase
MSFPENVARLQRELFSIAVSDEAFQGTRRLVERIVAMTGANGAVLWNLRGTDPPAAPYPLLASDLYFDNDPTHFWHKLSMKSPTGQALGAHRTEPEYVAQARIEEAFGKNPKDPDFDIIKRLEIRSFLIVPLYYSGRAWGALNLYWRETGMGPSEAYKNAIQEVAGLIPDLHEVIDKRTGFDLIYEVSALTGGKEAGPLAPEQRREVLKRIVKLVETTFNVAEVSIYLDADEAGHRTLRHEISQWPVKDTRIKQQYAPGEGLTGYCYQKSVSLLIPDLADLKDGAPSWLTDQYKGLKPTARAEFVEELKNQLPRNVNDEPPPVSWLAVPLHDGARTFGVIRICGSKSGPYHFHERHQRLLEIVASQVGLWYGGNVRLSRAELDKQTLKAAVDGLSQLNSKIIDRVTHPNATLEDSRRLLFAESMKIVRISAPNAEINSIRLVDPKKRILSFEHTDGERWTQGSKSEIDARLAATFLLDGAKPDSAGAQVVARNRPVLVLNTAKSEFRSVLFSDVVSMLIVPVAAGQSVLGTLDMRSTEPRAFGDLDVQIALLAGRQLFALKAAREEQEFQKNSLRMTLENLEHQLKTPVYLATRRADRLQSKARKQFPTLEQDLGALTGLCRRSEHIVKNVRLFAALARNEKLRLEADWLRAGPVIEMLNEFKRDYVLLSDPSRHLQIEVAENSFAVLDTIGVRADPQLLQQMLGNLLENAVKYSYANTVIRIRGVMIRNDTCFAIGVANKGVPVTKERAKNMTDRGERADQATLRGQDKALYEKSEGTGLGLYLVNEIISAHGGFLDIEPTNSQTGMTEFRIAFPKNRS